MCSHHDLVCGLFYQASIEVYSTFKFFVLFCFSQVICQRHLQNTAEVNVALLTDAYPRAETLLDTDPAVSGLVGGYGESPEDSVRWPHG